MFLQVRDCGFLNFAFSICVMFCDVALYVFGRTGRESLPLPRLARVEGLAPHLRCFSMGFSFQLRELFCSLEP
jgi:hypothetical protein